MFEDAHNPFAMDNGIDEPNDQDGWIIAAYKEHNVLQYVA